MLGLGWRLELGLGLWHRLLAITTWSAGGIRCTECRLVLVCFIGIHSLKIGLFTHLYRSLAVGCWLGTRTRTQFQSTVSRTDPT